MTMHQNSFSSSRTNKPIIDATRTLNCRKDPRNPPRAMDISLSLILTIVAGALAIYHLFIRKPDKFKKNGILHLKTLPIFGNMAPALFRRCPVVKVINDAYDLDDRAAYVGFYDFSDPVILVRSPELIKNIAVKSFDHFVDHRGFVDVEQDPLFGKNLFSIRGQQWKDVRSVLTPAFTGSKMKGMYRLMSNCAKGFADHLAESSRTVPLVMDVKDAFTRYTNDVIASCAFGMSTDSMRDPENEFYVMGRKTTKLEGLLTVKFFLLGGFPKLSKFLKIRLIDPIAARFFEGIVRETIEERDRNGVSRPDMLQLMMETRGKKNGNVPELTIQDMAAQAFGFFFAGFDSTSAFMCFLAHELAVNEDVQTRLQEEIDAVVRDHGDDPNYDTINEMVYLDAVISEGLRKYPGAPFLDRRCVKDFELPPALPGGKPVTIEAGTSIWFPVFAIHRDPKYYPEPEKFDPERFIGDRKNDIDPFTYFPFGQGPRMCIGYRFALLESKVVFFHLLAKCHLRRSPRTVVPMRISKGSFGLAAEGGFWLQIESRQIGTSRSNGTTNGVAKH